MARRYSPNELRTILEDEDDFATWQAAYRQSEADRGGRSFINGRPAEEVVDVAEVEVLPAPVSAPPSRMVAGAYDAMLDRSAGGRDADAREADRLGNSASADRYRSFLSERGQDAPIHAVSIAEQDAAMRLQDDERNERARFGIAARQAARSGRDGLASEILSQRDALFPVNRNSEVNRQYWLERLRRGMPQIPDYRAPANGFNSFNGRLPMSNWGVS